MRARTVLAVYERALRRRDQWLLPGMTRSNEAVIRRCRAWLLARCENASIEAPLPQRGNADGAGQETAIAHSPAGVYYTPPA